ncbi:MAG: TolC family protein, partial [Odoribacteraceae bacterium]|nr:TolC family protein [Odoribacteraceae bacterium]
MNTKRLLPILLLLASPWARPAAAQPLHLRDCIRQAIESNFDIKIVRNRAAIAANNSNNSPYLPAIELNARQNQTINTTRLRDNTGVTTRSADAVTDNYSAGVAISWRLFDGLDMFATRQRARELETIGQLALQQDVERVIMEVCSLYYNIVVQQYRLQAARRTMQLSSERYEDAQFRHAIGKISGLEAKQAIVDLHADSSAYVRLEEQLKNTYIALDKTMNADLQRDAYIRDTILMGQPLDPATLQRETIANNKLLEIARGQRRVSLLDYKKARALLFPTLDLNTGYNYTRASTPSATTVLNRVNGPYWGLSVNLPLLRRAPARVQVQNARLEVENE